MNFQRNKRIIFYLDKQSLFRRQNWQSRIFRRQNLYLQQLGVLATATPIIRIDASPISESTKGETNKKATANRTSRRPPDYLRQCSPGEEEVSPRDWRVKQVNVNRRRRSVTALSWHPWDSQTSGRRSVTGPSFVAGPVCYIAVWTRALRLFGETVWRGYIITEQTLTVFDSEDVKGGQTSTDKTVPGPGLVQRTHCLLSDLSSGEDRSGEGMIYWPRAGSVDTKWEDNEEKC